MKLDTMNMMIKTRKMLSITTTNTEKQLKL